MILQRELDKDLKGRIIIKYTLPPKGTKLVINGNEFQIIDVRNKGKKIIAEFIGRFEPLPRPSDEPEK